MIDISNRHCSTSSLLACVIARFEGRVALRLQSGVMHGVLASTSCVDDKQGMLANAHIVNQINLMLIILFVLSFVIVSVSLFVLPMYYQRIAENGGIEAIKL